jgi:hypothetical protein
MHPFCEIFSFEEYLCCRVCAFEEVCTKAPAFRLPCERLIPHYPAPPKVIPLEHDDL